MGESNPAPFLPAKVPWPQPGTWQCHLLALSLVLPGAALGIMGAFFQELRSGDILLPFLAAPIIEEVLKPVGVYILLLRWPHILNSQLYTAGLSALSGFSFAIVESTVYVNLYVPQHSTEFVVYRYSVPLVMHTLTSFIIGLGVNQRLLASLRGEIPLLEGSRRFFITSIVLHALFNVVATVLAAVGILDLE